MKRKVEYSSNNSGGSWWLSDKDWKALEKAGWKVAWFAKDKYEKKHLDKNGRWLGALARNATRLGLSMQEAVAEWEEVTGKSSAAAGCPCCGQPHSFTYYENGEYKESGPHTSYGASW
jgi:hypothetical protein